MKGKVIKMTTKELIQKLKTIDPDGNLTIALVHRDEYLETEPLNIELINKKEFNNRYEDMFDTSDFKGKKKIVLITPFND